MYVVQDISKLNVMIPDREKAEQIQSDLAKKHPDGNWRLFTLVGETSALDMEMLYALATELVEIAGVNPFNIELQVTNPDRSTENVTAVGILHRARNWLDQLQEIPS